MIKLVFYYSLRSSESGRAFQQWYSRQTVERKRLYEQIGNGTRAIRARIRTNLLATGF